MSYEMKELSGSLFKNDHKEKETHPNLQGSALINGVEYWISGWTKTQKSGDKWISVAFKPKDAKTGGSMDEPKRPHGKTPNIDDLDDDIPF